MSKISRKVIGAMRSRPESHDPRMTITLGSDEYHLVPGQAYLIQFIKKGNKPLVGEKGLFYVAHGMLHVPEKQKDEAKPCVSIRYAYNVDDSKTNPIWELDEGNFRISDFTGVDKGPGQIQVYWRMVRVADGLSEQTCWDLWKALSEDPSSPSMDSCFGRSSFYTWIESNVSGSSTHAKGIRKRFNLDGELISKGMRS